MSVITSLDNQNKIIRVTGTTTAASSGCRVLYLTIPNWPVFANVNTITIVSSADSYTSGTMGVAILSDGAAFRAQISGDINYSNASFISTFSATKIASVSLNWTYDEDVQRVGCLYVMITSTADITAGTTFTVTVGGKKLEVYDITDSDQTPFLLDRSWKVLQQTTSGTTDYTQQALRNGDPYTQGDINHSATFPGLITTTDYLYVGSTNQFTRFYVSMRGTAGIGSGIPVTSEYWNGSTWTSFAPIDNTSDGQASPSSFSYTGVITLPSLTSWTPTQIATDPLKVYLDAVNAGTAQAPGASYNPNRYWIRFSASTLAAELDLVGLQPLKTLAS